MSIDLILSPNQARQEVGTRLNASISRTAFYQWRKFLGLLGVNLTLDCVYALSVFGSFVRSGQTFEIALVNTKTKLRNEGK